MAKIPTWSPNMTEHGGAEPEQSGMLTNRTALEAKSLNLSSETAVKSSSDFNLASSIWFLSVH
jgi:hypothetical protein